MQREELDLQKRAQSGEDISADMEGLERRRRHLQLLHDVVTRWSSTYLMIDCALDLRKVVLFLSQNF